VATARLLDALASADAGLLVVAVALHVSAQVCRGLAWRGVLAAVWPEVTRRRACAWHVCGAGLSGALSARGADTVRIVLARRELPDATCAALAGTLVAEGSLQSVCGLVVGLVALSLGAGSLDAPPAGVLAAVAVGASVAAIMGARSSRVRRIATEIGRGLRVIRRPRHWGTQVLPWQVSERLFRTASAACFLLAFGLPATPAVVLAAWAAQGSGGILPVPGAGPAAAGAALLIAVPMAAGQAVAPSAVVALAIAQPAVLTAVGLMTSAALLAALPGACSPLALVRAARALRPRPAPAQP
jgi:hypothetical protein